MAKRRLRITLDEQQALRIREYADRAGLDVSTFVTSAAIHQMIATNCADGLALTSPDPQAADAR